MRRSNFMIVAGLALAALAPSGAPVAARRRQRAAAAADGRTIVAEVRRILA